MKTNFLLFVLLLTGTLFLNSCDEETTDLLTDLAQGKMVVVINDGEPVTMEDCKWMNYGADMKGEVFVEAHLNGESTEPFISIMYGSWANQDPFLVKTYTTGVEVDKINFMSSYGNAAENAQVVIEVVEITATGIKGKFSGKVLAEDETLVNVEGAFWALKFEHPM
jgi:hypothetical protein